jgi:hypothetical protein
MSNRTIVVTREKVDRAEGLVSRFTVSTRTNTGSPALDQHTEHATRISDVQAREVLEGLGATISEARDLVAIADRFGLAVK